MNNPELQDKTTINLSSNKDSSGWNFSIIETRPDSGEFRITLPVSNYARDSGDTLTVNLAKDPSITAKATVEPNPSAGSGGELALPGGGDEGTSGGQSGTTGQGPPILKFKKSSYDYFDNFQVIFTPQGIPSGTYFEIEIFSEKDSSVSKVRVKE